MFTYGAGDWNALHQDLYGELYFPMQVVVGLNASALYTGIALGTGLGGLLLPAGAWAALAACAGLAALSLLCLAATRRHGG